MKTNNNGFGIHGIVAGLCVFGVVGLVGWRVITLQRQPPTEPASQGAAGQSSEAPAVPVPAGWKLFANKDSGVQFVYPEAFGVFKPLADFGSGPDMQDRSLYDQVLVSDTPAAPYMPGLSGAFRLYTFKKGDMETDSRKYGPKVKLEGDKWIVTKANPYYNPEGYKPGDEYPEMTLTNTGGLNVYTAKSGDAGVINYDLYFVIGGRLRELALPTFDTGTYGGAPTVNDQSLYDDLYGQVVNSVSLY